MDQIFDMPVKLSSGKWKGFRLKILKWIQSNSHFTDKEVNYCLRSVILLPISYQFVFLDLLVLNKILTRKLPLEAEQFWQKRNGHPKTRSN